MLFSLTMLPPIGVSLYFADGNWQPFSHAFVALLVLGALIWWPVRTASARAARARRLPGRRAVLGRAGRRRRRAAAAVRPKSRCRVTDAVFEAVSGFTTTGATVLVGLDAMPQSVLYYRVQIEWLGGIGMVVLAVALLPMLGVGGMQLLRAETPGPGQGFEAHAAHHRDRQGAVDRSTSRSRSPARSPTGRPA